MYCVYQNRGQRSITLGVMSLCRFLITYVCGPTSMKLIPNLVSKVREVKWQNGGQGPITWNNMSLHRFSNFAFLENFRNRFLRNYES